MRGPEIMAIIREMIFHIYDAEIKLYKPNSDKKLRISNTSLRKVLRSKSVDPFLCIYLITRITQKFNLSVSEAIVKDICEKIGL
jgi:hypothetical protein